MSTNRIKDGYPIPNLNKIKNLLIFGEVACFGKELYGHSGHVGIILGLDQEESTRLLGDYINMIFDPIPEWMLARNPLEADIYLYHAQKLYPFREFVKEHLKETEA